MRVFHSCGQGRWRGVAVGTAFGALTVRLRVWVRQKTHSQVLGADAVGVGHCDWRGVRQVQTSLLQARSLLSSNKPSIRTSLQAPLVQMRTATASQSGLLGTVVNLDPIARRPLEKMASVNVVSVELVTSVPSTMR